MNPINRRTFVIFALSFAFVLFVGKAYYDTNTIEVKHYQIKESSLGEALAGLKVAFLSDLHIRKIDVRENKILEILHEEKPDLILLSGDYISFEGSYEPVMSFFHQFEAPYGIYGVLGNTEYSNENGSCILCHHEKSKGLKEKQIPIFLRNAASVFEANHKKINIFGVDDPVNKKSDLKTTLKKANLSGPSILLAHSPEVFEEASGCGIDLVLCGHNHGGQIFMTKLLRKILPFDPVLEYLGGFFQKEKTLMYVSRGVGPSYLPFRLGVKPEITFFTFSNNTNEKIRMSRINPTNLSREMRPALCSVEATTSGSLFHRDPSNSMNPTNSTNSSNSVNPTNTFSISNHPSKTIFTGLTLSNFLETFNVLRVFDSLGLTATPQHSNTDVLPLTSNGVPLQPPTKVDPSNSSNVILFDFESVEDLKRLNWECHKWFELSAENATSGKHSLKVSLPPGQYPGINFEKIRTNWSEGSTIGMDVLNPSEEKVTFHIRLDDNKSGWEYANRFDINFELKPGMNHISIPTDSIRTNIHHRPLNLKRIKRMMVLIPNNSKKRELYIDNIRLE